MNESLSPPRPALPRSRGFVRTAPGAIALALWRFPIALAVGGLLSVPVFLWIASLGTAQGLWKGVLGTDSGFGSAIAMVTLGPAIIAVGIAATVLVLATGWSLARLGRMVRRAPARRPELLPPVSEPSPSRVSKAA